MDTAAITEFIAKISAAIPLGPIAIVGAVLMFAIRLYQQYGQYVLPQGARWDSLPPLAKLVLPFALSLLGGTLFAVASGSAVLPALAVTLPAALAAIGLHYSTKAAGQALQDAALKKDAYYTPSPLRNAMSIVVPLPKIAPLHDLKP